MLPEDNRRAPDGRNDDASPEDSGDYNWDDTSACARAEDVGCRKSKIKKGMLLIRMTGRAA